jgi:hypothetical protein
MMSKIVRIIQTTRAVREVVVFFAPVSLKTACATVECSYHSWASPDCVVPDASGKFFARVWN